jgi:hypothetical protein
LCSYIVEVQSQGWKELNNKIPSIFEIQEFIEHAWDLGINAQGRIETGGIRGTRKYIGTTDVCPYHLVEYLSPRNQETDLIIRLKQCFAVLI